MASVSLILRCLVVTDLIARTVPTTDACRPGTSVPICADSYDSHPKGSVRRRSRTVRMPSFARRATFVGPIVFNVSTEASRLRGRERMGVDNYVLRRIFGGMP